MILLDMPQDYLEKFTKNTTLIFVSLCTKKTRNALKTSVLNNFLFPIINIRVLC